MSGTDHLVTYLALTPAFGGTRFGPFEGLEVRLGADADRCHIVLPASLGVLPEHVKLIRQGPMNLILAPAERTATVFLYKQSARSPVQLNTPTAVRPGDSFALVTPDGPRFIVEVGELPEEIKKQREGRGGGRRFGGRRFPDGDAFKQEGKRQIWTTLLTTGPGQLFQRAYTYIVSGAILQPRNIIMFAMLLIGGGGIGLQSCRLNKTRRALSTTTTRAASCQEQLDRAEDLGGNVEGYEFDEFITRLLSSSALGIAVRDDPKLGALVREKAKLIDTDSFAWVATTKGTQAKNLGAWRKALENQKRLDSDTRTLLQWAAVSGGMGQARFRVITDSTGAEACGRGVLGLTYRQSHRLGIRAQPEAYFLGDTTALPDNGAMGSHVQSNTTIPTSFTWEEGGEFDIYDVNSRERCVYRADGEDHRDSMSRLASDLSNAVGERGTLLPDTNASWSAVARVAKLYVADVPKVDLLDRRDPGVDFSENHVSTALKDVGAGSDWVLERTADAIAHALVLPCIAVLQGKDEAAVKNMLGENLPSPIECLIFDYRLRNED